MRLSATVGVIGQGWLGFVQPFVHAAVLLAVLLCIPALAQEKPEAPKPKTGRKVFFAGTVLLDANNVTDAITTRQVLDRGGWEGNPVSRANRSGSDGSLLKNATLRAKQATPY